MNDLLILVQRTLAADGYTVTEQTEREVLCRLASIGQTEFYQAQATSLRPELKFVLADYLDYNGETLCIHEGIWYRVIRTYRARLELEIVVQRAAPEEVEAYG